MFTYYTEGRCHVSYILVSKLIIASSLTCTAINIRLYLLLKCYKLLKKLSHGCCSFRELDHHLFITMLLLHVLILSLLSGGSARVVQDFESECGQFFANEKSPTKFPDPQYRQMCQTRNNVVYYATNMTPVYC